MNIPWDSINGFAGAAGLGAICVLGFFFIIDGKDSNIFHTLNSYASTASWGILAAVPTIAISFLVGQFAILLGSFLAHLIIPNSLSEVSSLIIISKTQNEFLAQEYLRIKQEKGMLCGSSLSFIFLGIGAFFEVNNLASHKRVIYLCALSSVIIGITLFILGIQKIYLLNDLISNTSQNIQLLKK